jgi:hypothetical protein
MSPYEERVREHLQEAVKRHEVEMATMLSAISDEDDEDAQAAAVVLAERLTLDGDPLAEDFGPYLPHALLAFAEEVVDKPR